MFINGLGRHGMYFNLDGGGGTVDGSDANADTDTGLVTDSVVDTSDLSNVQDVDTIEVDGKNYTLDQIKEMEDAYTNRTKWTQENQRRAQELNTLASVLESQRGQTTQQGQTQQYQPPTPETIRDEFLDTPEKALEYFREIARQEAQAESANAKAEADFLAKNSDFNDVIRSPEFAKFKAENQHYNDVNAYFAVKVTQAKAEVEEAKKEAYAKAEADVLKNLKAKGTLKGLGDRSGVSPTTVSKADIGKMSHSERVANAAQAIELKRLQGD